MNIHYPEAIEKCENKIVQNTTVKIYETYFVKLIFNAIGGPF